MKIEERKITVRELAEGYVDSEEEGVRGFGGTIDGFIDYLKDNNLLQP